MPHHPCKRPFTRKPRGVPEGDVGRLWRCECGAVWKIAALSEDRIKVWQLQMGAARDVMVFDETT